jgi:hypothetical protein
MLIVMDEAFAGTLERIRKKRWWTVAALAEVLGRPKKYVYRKIEDEKFQVLIDGGYIKVLSESVAGYFEER